MLTTDRAGADETIEVAHEALIREWGTLRGWLHDSREDVLLGNALSDAAEAWAARGRPADRLYRGNVLDEARTWEGRNSANAREREFIDTSARTQAETLASEQKRQSQLRRAGIGVVALAIVLVLTFIGSLIFQIQTQAANNNTLLGERNRAESNLRDACDSQALFLADLSRQQLEAHAY